MTVPMRDSGFSGSAPKRQRGPLVHEVEELWGALNEIQHLFEMLAKRTAALEKDIHGEQPKVDAKQCVGMDT